MICENCARNHVVASCFTREKLPILSKYCTWGTPIGIIICILTLIILVGGITQIFLEQQPGSRPQTFSICTRREDTIVRGDDWCPDIGEHGKHIEDRAIYSEDRFDSPKS